MNFVDVAKNKLDNYRVTKPGRYIFFLNNYSGNLTVEIDASHVEAYIYGVYVGRQKNIFKLNTIQLHKQPNSFSDLLIKGIFYDESKFIYEGLIRIEKRAQKSHAYQKNQNIIMSDQCFVDSRPFLEILANDVFCTHGSTTGKLDKEQLLYIESRGVSKLDAEKLLLQGFIDDIVHKVIEKGGSNYMKAYNIAI